MTGDDVTRDLEAAPPEFQDLEVTLTGAFAYRAPRSLRERVAREAEGLRATPAHRTTPPTPDQRDTPMSAMLPTSSPLAVADVSASSPSGRRGSDSRPALYPLGRRVMGMVATLTLFALVGLLALAVYLNAPRNPTPPSTSLAGAVIGTPSPDAIASPAPVRVDATAASASGPIWTLPTAAFVELPPAESYGAGWHTIPDVTLVQQPGTTFQIETRYYVDGEGNRIRIQLVRYTADAQFDEAFTYFADELLRYQDMLYLYGEIDDPQLLQQPLAGCDQTVRAAGYELVTGFPNQVTLCRSDELGMMIFVSVNGRVQHAPESDSSLPADVVVTGVLGYSEPVATPTT